MLDLKHLGRFPFSYSQLPHTEGERAFRALCILELGGYLLCFRSPSGYRVGAACSAPPACPGSGYLGYCSVGEANRIERFSFIASATLFPQFISMIFILIAFRGVCGAVYWYRRPLVFSSNGARRLLAFRFCADCWEIVAVGLLPLRRTNRGDAFSRLVQPRSDY